MEEILEWTTYINGSKSITNSNEYKVYKFNSMYHILDKNNWTKWQDDYYSKIEFLTEELAQKECQRIHNININS